MVYDAVIVGTGPAGVSAALTLKANDKNFLWIGSKNLSGKVAKAERIANYPGLPMVSGAKMNEIFQKQSKELEIGILDRMVNSVIEFGDHYALTAGEDFYETRTVLLATGVAAVNTLPKEEELLGKGVSYCATCDGALYRKKTIAVLCAGKRFEHEVNYLADLADKVYFLPLYRDPSIDKSNVEYLSEMIAQVNGENERLSSITLKSGRIIPVQGLFCLRESISLATLLPKLESDQGHIAVNRKMETNLRGCFAAGDCTGRPYQYAKAVGEGNVAAHSIIEYLAL